MNDDDLKRTEAYEALHRYIDRLLTEQKLELPPGLSQSELTLYVLATEMKGLRPGVDEPSEEFLNRLQASANQAFMAGQHHSSANAGHKMSRGGFLRAAGALAAGVIVGVAVDHLLEPSLPSLPALIGENGHWYLLASTADLPVGSVRRFSAGGIDGYILNENGRYRAVSAICTHMGCHIDWQQENGLFHCLCHGAQFKQSGAVAAGVPPRPLPAITVREDAGNVYAWGTQQSTWGTL